MTDTSVSTINMACKSMKLLKFIAEYHIQKKLLSKEKLAKWVKKNFISLGPAFVKVGQFISSREDIFDKHIVEEMKSLQDDVPSFPFENVLEIIGQELGRPIDDVFEFIQEVPLGVASIGQVHLAKLKTGEMVVVKVKRPDIRRHVEEDYRSMKMFLNVASFFSKDCKDTHVITDDLYTNMLSEVSFKQELENIVTLADNSFGENVRIPAPYTEYSTNNMLVLEYIDSKKVDQVEKNPQLAKQIMTYFLKQMCEHGMVHADPHPGNVGVCDGSLVLYDFGQVLKMGDAFTSNIKMLLYAIHQGDVDMICSLLVDSKIVVLTDDAAHDVLRSIVETASGYLQDMDFENMKSSFFAKQLKILDHANIDIDGKVVLLLRCISLLEGICLTLDPDFNYGIVLKDMVEYFLG